MVMQDLTAANEVNEWKGKKEDVNLDIVDNGFVIID